MKIPHCSSVIALLVTATLAATIPSTTFGQPAESPDIYARLNEAAAAQALALTSEQQAEVKRLITQRDAELAAAENDAARDAVRRNAEQQLKAVLTADQQSKFTELFQEPRLRFNFRFQKWADVLNWMATEAELSLVMDEPPAGTFNYSDNKEYTPTEAIDLLNGWLLTKGYTLVRRERLLMCLNLKDGLPDDAIPRVTTEELPLRGRFEFVSTLIPLEGRPAETVLTEITPLLGKYGDARMLAATQQLLVADAASTVRTIAAVVQQVPVPKKPEPPAAKPPAPKPELKIYPIQHANPKQAGEVLKSMINGTLLVDEAANQISINATPDEHAKAQLIIRQLETNQGPDRQPTLKLYSARVRDADEMLSTLKLIVPDASFRYDAASRKLVAFATADDHLRVADSLERLQTEQLSDGPEQLEVYALGEVDPTAAQTLITSLLPDARVTLDSRTGSLIAVATQADHDAILRLLEQLEPRAAGAEQPVLKSYPLKPNVTADIVTSLLRSIVPKASVTQDSPNRRLLITAAEEDHARIAAAIAQVEADAGGERPELQYYPLRKASGTNAATVLQAMLPSATVTFENDGRRLSVVATETDHAVVRATLEKLEQTAPADEQRILKIYDVSSEQRRRFTAVLESLTTEFSGMQVLTDSQPGEITVWAKPSQHEVVSRVLGQLQHDVPADEKPKLVVYPITKVDPSGVSSVLTELFPDAKITTDTTARRLMIHATPALQQSIKQAIEQLDSDLSGETEIKLMVYPVHGIDPANARQLLSTEVPRATVIHDATAHTFIVRARAEQQRQVAKLLDELRSAGSDPASQQQLQVYDLRGSDPAAVRSILQPLVDEDVQLTVDASGRQLFVRAFSDRHEAIRRLIEQVTSGLKPDQALDTRTYLVGASNADEAQEVLLALYPDATIVTDDDRKLIVATATPEQHVMIEKIAKQIAGSGTMENAPYPVVYETRNVDASRAEDLLDDLFRPADGVRLSVNQQSQRLVAIAREDQHALIRSLLEQFDGEPIPEKEKQLAAYRVAPLDALTVKEILEPLVSPDTKISAGRRATDILVSAPADEQARIAALLQEMTMPRAGGSDSETRTYRLSRGDADEAQEALTALFPDAVLVTDTGREVLIATASPEQHQTIEQVVKQMTGELRTDGGPQPKAYRLNQADGDTVKDVIQELFDNDRSVSVSLDRRSRTVVVIARSEQHALIEGLLRELDPQDADSAYTLQVYSTEGLDVSQVRQVIEDLLADQFRNSKVRMESVTGNLFVTTTREGHDLTQQALDQFGKPKARRTEVFRLSFLEPQAAQSAVETMIADPSGNKLNEPLVQADDDLQQLWVQASEEQITEIRSLLVKMGEAGLDTDTGASGRRTLRVVPFGDDAEEAVDRIQDLWPRIRRNPIRILKPGNASQLRGSHFSVPVEQITDAESAAPNEEADTTLVAEEQSSDEQPPAIVIVPGDGKITIASDDIDALDQMEALLRAVNSQSAGIRNRDFSVYQFRNAGASDVAATLQQIFDDPRSLVTFGEVVLVPDERLNALIVHASRTDRSRIAQLLEILDSDKLEDTQRAFRTDVVPLLYADAERIKRVLEGVYKAQMTAGGARSAISIPKGVPSDVASVLRQINAAASSPLLTVEVQAETNSLVVKAPEALMAEVSELIDRLDEAARTNRSRGLKLVPLKRTNSARVMKILGNVLD
ncbi:MAG: secretin N-terminal domain-containing protein [Planctomycetaceae bacterium]